MKQEYLLSPIEGNRVPPTPPWMKQGCLNHLLGWTSVSYHPIGSNRDTPTNFLPETRVPLPPIWSHRVPLLFPGWNRGNPLLCPFGWNMGTLTTLLDKTGLPQHPLGWNRGTAYNTLIWNRDTPPCSCWMNHGYELACSALCMEAWPIETCTAVAALHLNVYCQHLKCIDAHNRNLWRLIFSTKKSQLFI